MTDTQAAHPAVPHPGVVARPAGRDRRFWGLVLRGNDWLAVRLGLVFGSVWIVWAFFLWPLIARQLGAAVQADTSYYAQSWIQLFALPLFVYIGNRLQRSADAQSEVMHQALTHIATVSDQNQRLIEENTRLTREVHALTAEVRSYVAARER